MGITKVDQLNTATSRAYLAGDLPTTPQGYYGTGTGDVDSIEWRGGEIAYNTRDNRFYIQVNTSGTTASWKRFLDTTTAA